MFSVFHTLLTFSFTVLPTLSIPVPRAPVCNDHEELCARKYSDVTFVGAHDSPFVGDLLTQNQNIDVTDQLDLGIRYLQGQTHRSLLDPDILELCHTSCIEEDAGSLSNYLKTVVSWLSAHPQQVITLLLTNGDNVDVSLFDKAFKDAEALDFVYTPTNGAATALKLDSWPTLGNMIDSGKRLVVFLDYGADASKATYILDEFAYYFETPFDTTDPKFPQCDIDRPSGASATGRMALVNHFLDINLFGILIPNEAAAPTTNGAASITAQTNLCHSAHGRTPNVVLLDYIDKGQAVQAQNTLNGL